MDDRAVKTGYGEWIRHTGELTGIYSEPFDSGVPFMDLARRFAFRTGTVVLCSGGDVDSARYHILAAKPWLTVLGLTHCVDITVEDQTRRFTAPVFEVLDVLLKTYTLPYHKNLNPVSAGFLGYLSYDLKDELEVLPRTSVDDLRLPRLLMFAPSILVVYDKVLDTARLIIPERIKCGKSSVEADLRAFHQIMAEPVNHRSATNQFDQTDVRNLKTSGVDAPDSVSRQLNANLTQQEYISAVNAVKEYIAAGHVYQVNLSQRFETGFTGDPFALFENLFTLNPAPFFAYINGGSHYIVSTSPERFLLRDGRRVETRPIKGTRPRGLTEDEDLRLKAELTASSKDDAELSMIVDLLRNDLGKVCQAGSVQVTAHKRVEAYTNVFHLVSTVEGLLDHDQDSTDLIRAAFPGGSITGCPKIRAMEIIDELEPQRRHIYTGSIGYISFHQTMDLSIAIRTASIVRDRIYFSVGGGIVFDSDPVSEYQETLHKGRTLTQAVAAKSLSSGKPSGYFYVWLNGKLVAAENAVVPLLSLGFQYGCGIFETLRVNSGKPVWLAEHITRFNSAWKSLFNDDPPDQTWDTIIDQVIRASQLEQQTAAVKIIGARLSRTEEPFDYLLAVSARPYHERPAEKSNSIDSLKGQISFPKGLRLAIYPYPRMTPLADKKTLNYFYYHQAETWAAKNQSDTALILNPDGSVSETGIANIIMITGNTVIIPQSEYVLPGITQSKIIELLKQQGFTVKTQPVMPDFLFNTELTLITNSLIGCLPAISLDGKELPMNKILISLLNRLWSSVFRLC